MGLPERRRMTLAPGERGWLVAYGILSWIYRIGITFGLHLAIGRTMPGPAMDECEHPSCFATPPGRDFAMMFSFGQALSW